jgi:Transcriptional regulatory protein, C terminal
MRAVLRRAAGPAHRRLAVRDLDIDLASRVVRVGGERVQLSAKEYELFVAFAEDPERVFKKEELLRNVWGFRSLGSKHRTRPNATAGWLTMATADFTLDLLDRTQEVAGSSPASSMTKEMGLSRVRRCDWPLRRDTHLTHPQQPAPRNRPEDACFGEGLAGAPGG